MTTTEILADLVLGPNWVAFAPDSRHIIVTGSRGAAVLDVDDPDRQAIRLEYSDLVRAEFSPDGRLIVTLSGDGTARLWDAKTGTSMPHVLKLRGEVTWATFSPDSRYVLTTGQDHNAILWDSFSGAERHRLPHADFVLMGSFSRDGKRIVTAGRDYSARVWDAETGKSISSLEGHGGLVTCAHFSPDGALVVTASQDGKARIWDALSGKLLSVMSGHLSDVRWAEFSPDGTLVVTASEDRSTRIWDTHLEMRSPTVIAELVKSRAPWRLEGERLVPAELPVQPAPSADFPAPGHALP